MKGLACGPIFVLRNENLVLHLWVRRNAPYKRVLFKPVIDDC